MKIEVNNPCFICKASQSELIFEKEYLKFNYPGKFLMRKCKKCGLLFNSPRLSAKKFPELYGESYYFFQRDDFDEFHRIAHIYLRTIALVHNKISNKKVIEIGSGKGYLLALLKHLGWDVKGIEISSVATQYALNKFGVLTFEGTVEEFLSVTHNYGFPIVLAIDVLEHLLDPLKFLRSINEIIQKGGILIIDTPNSDSYNIEINGALWSGFNPFHIFIFSKNNLITLLDNIGYKIEKVFSYGNVIEKQTNGFQKIINDLKEVLKSLLQRFAVLNESKKLYLKLKRLQKHKREDLYYLLRSAVKIIEKNSSYFEVADSREELAQNCRGDNIVIIARKI